MSSGTSIPHDVVNKRQSVAAVGPTEAQIMQVILVAYWLNIGTILVQCRPIWVQNWPMFHSNIGPIF